MEIRWPRLTRPGTLVVLLGAMALSAAAQTPAQPSAPGDTLPAAGAAAAATPAETGRELFAKLVERNRERAARLKHYTGTRQYELRDSKGKLSARAVVHFRYRAPDSKSFQTVSEQGSRWIRLFIFNRLISSEKEAAAGRDKRDSAITPHNYSFRYLDEEAVDGYPCYHFQALPKRQDKYLFEGEVWVDSRDFAVVRIAGHPARNPSFWIKRVEWVRDYRKVDGFWLPVRDNTVAHIRIFGEKRLTIDYQNYVINGPSTPWNPSSALLPPQAGPVARDVAGREE
jgi:hypothetical protein